MNDNEQKWEELSKKVDDWNKKDHKDWMNYVKKVVFWGIIVGIVIILLSIYLIGKYPWLCQIH